MKFAAGVLQAQGHWVAGIVQAAVADHQVRPEYSTWHQPYSTGLSASSVDSEITVQSAVP